MARVSKEEYEERLADTEQTMIRLRSAYRVETTLSRKHNVDQRTVRKWMKAVRDRWKANAAEVDKDERREDLAAIVNDVIFQAMNRSFIVKQPDGTVVLDPQTGKPVVKANPDLQKVLNAISHLRAIYGVDAASTVKVKVSPDVTHLPDFNKLPPEAIAPMEALLKSVAPDGDISKLAGEWFTFDDPSKTETSGDS